MAKIINTAQVFDQTFTRTGKKVYTHAVAILRGDNRVDISFSGSHDLAVKNYDSMSKRIRTAKGGGTLPYPWSTKHFAAIQDIQIVPVTQTGA